MRVVSFILFAAISLQGLAQDGARTFELNTPLPQAQPGMVTTSLPNENSAHATAVNVAAPTATPVSLVAGGLPPVPASMTPVAQATGATTTTAPSAPALSPTLAVGAGQPVKAYATLAQAAADGVNPLAVPKRVAVKPPVESSQLDVGLAWARSHGKEVGLGLLLMVLLAVGRSLWRRRSN